jgi:hypothetical protein
LSRTTFSPAPMRSDFADPMSRWWPTEADAVRLGVTLTAMYLAMYFELEEPHWVEGTVFSVSLATRASSIQKSTWRAFSTLLGAAVGIVLTDNFALSTLAYDIASALWLGIMTYCSSLERGLGSYGFALMGYTVPIGADEFIRRFLLHVLPKGFHRIRHYGLLASAGCKANIARAKELMAAPIPEVDPPAAHDTVDPHTTTDHRPPCPCCGGRMIIVEVFARCGAPRGPPSPGAGIRM